jgi:hypothetical protein
VAQALLELGTVDPRSLDHLAAGPVGSAAGPGNGSDGDHGEGVGTVAVPEEEIPFRIIHALKIKGFASAATVAEMSGVDEETAETELSRLLSLELVKFHEARGFWQVTPAGKEHHAGLLPGATDEQLAAVRAAYERFLELNVAFKELCISWQVRDGVPNDHTDEAYDAGRVAALGGHHSEADPVLAAFAGAIDRLGLYRVRLDEALQRVQAGERDAFTGVMKRSYHDVWMELHEDLLSILAIDRAAEGSF